MTTMYIQVENYFSSPALNRLSHAMYKRYYLKISLIFICAINNHLKPWFNASNNLYSIKNTNDAILSRS